MGEMLHATSQALVPVVAVNGFLGKLKACSKISHSCALNVRVQFVFDCMNRHIIPTTASQGSCREPSTGSRTCQTVQRRSDEAPYSEFRVQ